MPTTVVRLFEKPDLLNEAIREIEALGIPRQEIRSEKEPARFDVARVMNFPRLDFEVDPGRELTRIGATGPESQAYVEGLQRGGSLAFAGDGGGQYHEQARSDRNRKAQWFRTAAAPVVHQNITHASEGTVMNGRIRQSGGGAAFFVW